jgi:hypothetical protein
MRPFFSFPFRNLTVLLSVGSPILFGACQFGPKRAGPKETAGEAIEVGEIAVVDEKRGFVLVDLDSNLYVPAPGIGLRSRNAKGETAHLKAASEQKRPFIAADIIDGHPNVGDKVIQ